MQDFTYSFQPFCFFPVQFFSCVLFVCLNEIIFAYGYSFLFVAP